MNRFRKFRRENSHPFRVTGGRGVTRLNGVHTGPNKPFQELFDVSVQLGVVDGNGRLPTECHEQFLVFFVEGFARALV